MALPSDSHPPQLAAHAPDDAARIFVDPHAYACPDAWHAAAAWLRKNDPLPRVHAEGFPPFRAVTRHAHVDEIERHHEIFHNTVDSVLATTADIERRHAMPLIRPEAAADSLQTARSSGVNRLREIQQSR